MKNENKIYEKYFFLFVNENKQLQIVCYLNIKA